MRFLAYLICGLSTIGVFVIQFLILWFLTKWDALVVIAISTGITVLFSIGMSVKTLEILEDSRNENTK